MSNKACESRGLLSHVRKHSLQTASERHFFVFLQYVGPGYPIHGLLETNKPQLAISSRRLTEWNICSALLSGAASTWSFHGNCCNSTDLSWHGLGLGLYPGGIVARILSKNEGTNLKPPTWWISTKWWAARSVQKPTLWASPELHGTSKKGFQRVAATSSSQFLKQPASVSYEAWVPS